MSVERSCVVYLDCRVYRGNLRVILVWEVGTLVQDSYGGISTQKGMSRSKASSSLIFCYGVVFGMGIMGLVTILGRKRRSDKRLHRK